MTVAIVPVYARFRRQETSERARTSSTSGTSGSQSQGQGGGGMRAAAAYRCLDTSHPVPCDRCNAPPEIGEEDHYELVGDRGKKNGEKKLRGFLQKTVEWSDHNKRMRAVEAAEAANRSALVKVIRDKDVPGLRKGHLLFLMRHWGFQSDLWRPKQSSSKSRKGSQKSLSDAKSSDQHARTGEARPSKRGQKRQGAEADIKNRDNSNKASNSQEIRAAQRMRLGPMEGVWMAKPDTRANFANLNRVTSPVSRDSTNLDFFSGGGGGAAAAGAGAAAADKAALGAGKTSETSKPQATKTMAIVSSTAGQRHAFNDAVNIGDGGSNSAAAAAIAAARNIGNDRAVTSRDNMGGSDFSNSQHVTSVRTYINDQISPLVDEFLRAGADNSEFIETWELLWPKRQQHSLPNEDRIPDMIANAARLRADIHLMFLDEQNRLEASAAMYFEGPRCARCPVAGHLDSMADHFKQLMAPEGRKHLISALSAEGRQDVANGMESFCQEFSRNHRAVTSKNKLAYFYTTGIMAALKMTSQIRALLAWSGTQTLLTYFAAAMALQEFLYEFHNAVYTLLSMRRVTRVVVPTGKPPDCLISVLESNPSSGVPR